MSTRQKLVTLTSMVLAGFIGAVNPVFADPPLRHSDHALLNNLNHPGPDKAIYCGVKDNKGKTELFTLHVSATAGGSGGTLTLGFRDSDGIVFNVPANGSFSMTQALGGVFQVDDVIRISVSDGVDTAMASAQVNQGTQDPFAGDGEKDNFCITTDGPGGLDGVTLGIGGPNPFPLDGDGNLN